MARNTARAPLAYPRILASCASRHPDSRAIRATREDQLRRILHQEGFSFQRPKHTMKGKRDEAAYEKARRQLKCLKKGRLRMIAMLS